MEYKPNKWKVEGYAIRRAYINVNNPDWKIYRTVDGYELQSA